MMHRTPLGLQPLRRRLNRHQLQRRTQRIAMKKTRYDRIVQHFGVHAALHQQTLAVLRRGFWGRLKWLLFGR